MQGRADIGRFHVAVIDAEIEHQCHFGDEQKAEEERQPAQRFLPALFERHVVDLVDAGAERVKGRQHDDAGEDRIEAEIVVHHVGGVRAENDEGRMRDVDDVEDAERQRDARGHRRVKTADQNARDDGIHQEIERKDHYCVPTPSRVCRNGPRLARRKRLVRRQGGNLTRRCAAAGGWARAGGTTLKCEWRRAYRAATNCSMRRR